MKYAKLMEHRQKEKKFSKLMFILLIPGAITIFVLLFELLKEAPNLTAVSIAFVPLLGTVILAYIFSAKSSKYSRFAEDYIIVKIMDIIQESGISNFEIIEEVGGCYRVGFHNQTIDYDDMQSKINTALDEMNKISDRNIRVKLI